MEPPIRADDPYLEYFWVGVFYCTEEHIDGQGKRVIIYIGETDQWHHQLLFMASLEFLRREGCAGATVARGIAGFGANCASVLLAYAGSG